MSSSPVNVGDVLAGKYLVDRVLGIGGMGVVVAARHMQLDEQVAIKFLLPEAAKSPVLVTRFLREGRAAVKIRSEHVARVLDVGTLDDGAPYMVMEYLEGSDLGALVKTLGPLPIEEAIEYLLQACEAIAEAHVHGIVHRDLKPSNLFLTTRADGTPSIKVIDFGISKIGERPEGEMEITGTLEARGSPLFMSPEQMVSTRDVDARSDIWSLGIALYHLLTAEYPFQAPTMPQLCGLVLTASPIPLPVDVLGGATPDLEAALFRCFEKDPADRYQNVAELAQALAVFGPQEARISAERVTRIIRAAGHPHPQHGATGGTRTSSPAIGATPAAGAVSGGAQAGAAMRTSQPSYPDHSARVTRPSWPNEQRADAAGPAGGAVTAGPVVGPGEDADGPPPPRTGQIVLAAGIAAVVLTAVTTVAVLFFLAEGPRGGPPVSAAGPGSSSSALSGAAPPAPPAPLTPTALPAPTPAGPEPSPSASALAVPAPEAPLQPAATASASSTAAKPPGEPGNPTVMTAAPPGRPAPAVTAPPVATSKPSAPPAASRPKPSVDLFDTPK